MEIIGESVPFSEIASIITIDCDQNTKWIPLGDQITGEHDKVNKVFELRLSQLVKFTGWTIFHPNNKLTDLDTIENNLNEKKKKKKMRNKKTYDWNLLSVIASILTRSSRIDREKNKHANDRTVAFPSSFV